MGQLIISIGREFGSGGHVVAADLAKRFDLPVYDSNLLREIAAKKNVDVKNIEEYDEIPRMRFLSRNVNGYSNSPEEIIAHMQFDYLKEKAAAGESFVVIGRCSESILREYKGLVSVFILGDRKNKIARTMKAHNISAEEAEEMMIGFDKKRKMYHNYYCKGKWGDSRNYDLSINSKIGLVETADVVEAYIRNTMKL